MLMFDVYILKIYVKLTINVHAFLCINVIVEYNKRLLIFNIQFIQNGMLHGT